MVVAIKILIMSRRKNTLLLIYTSLFLIFSCRNVSNKEAYNKQISNIDIAAEFIDAFYSFNGDTLKSILNHAKESQPSILYYQKWAECGNYKVIKRHDCIIKNDSLMIYPITVKDDLIGALEIDFNVTDTFHITIIKGQIRSIQTSSNDPDLYHEAKEWVKQNRPELIEKPCKGIWDGGPTACECVKAMVEGFGEFNANSRTKF